VYEAFKDIKICSPEPYFVTIQTRSLGKEQTNHAERYVRGKGIAIVLMKNKIENPTKSKVFQSSQETLHLLIG